MDQQPGLQNDSLPNEKRPERKHLTDLDQIIHRHLNDEHDKITEEDIRDAVVGFAGEPSSVKLNVSAHSNQFLQEGKRDENPTA